MLSVLLQAETKLRAARGWGEIQSRHLPQSTGSKLSGEESSPNSLMWDRKTITG